MSRLKFPKKFRLLKRPQFKICYERGRRFFTSLFIIFRHSNELDYWRVGITVSKKIGKAVLRNRIKRLVREYFRLNQSIIPKGYDWVIIPKKHVHWKQIKLQNVQADLDHFFAKQKEHRLG